MSGGQGTKEGKSTVQLLFQATILKASIARLLPNMRRREKVMSTLAIIWSFIGGVGVRASLRQFVVIANGIFIQVILLSIFDTKRHPRLHRVFLLVFVAGTAFSAIFTIIEVGSILHLIHRCLSIAIYPILTPSYS